MKFIIATLTTFAVTATGIVPALAVDDPLAPAADRARVPHVWEMTVNTTGKVFDQTTRWEPEYLALDEVTESQVMATLDKLRSEGRTIVIVAHRLSTVARCDLVARLDHGRIVACGPTAEASLIGRDVRLSGAAVRPRAYRLTLGDHSEARLP